ncbi:CDK-activating kinase assembly factor MAT1 [Bonamia ostreae]|uniref:CDK-activating kinase assembly factor MAT1 n=1 Tax=Bonamia ostreae TaxID=126728 RepID=A0ABV2ALY3_9EUKA
MEHNLLWDKDFFEISNNCPECKLTKRNFKSLKLYYSNCCGLTLCLGCINENFSKKSDFRCKNCTKKLKKTDFVKDPFFRQKYYEQINSRKKLNFLSILEKEDFDDGKEFFDYYNKIAKILNMLTTGTTETQEKAKRQILELKENYSKLISRRKKENEENSVRLIEKSSNDIQFVAHSFKFPTIVKKDKNKKQKIVCFAGGFKKEYVEKKKLWNFRIGI